MDMSSRSRVLDIMFIPFAAVFLNVQFSIVSCEDSTRINSVALSPMNVVFSINPSDYPRIIMPVWFSFKSNVVFEILKFTVKKSRLTIDTFSKSEFSMSTSVYIIEAKTVADP